jgi:hypothetical protein
VRIRFSGMSCSAKHGVIGAAFFGPAGGDSAADTVFAQALSSWSAEF